MTISFLVVSRDMKSTHFFSSSYVSDRSTIFWNIVLFLSAGGRTEEESRSEVSGGERRRGGEVERLEKWDRCEVLVIFSGSHS